MSMYGIGHPSAWFSRIVLLYYSIYYSKQVLSFSARDDCSGVAYAMEARIHVRIPVVGTLVDGKVVHEIGLTPDCSGVQTSRTLTGRRPRYDWPVTRYVRPSRVDGHYARACVDPNPTFLYSRIHAVVTCS